MRLGGKMKALATVISIFHRRKSTALLHSAVPPPSLYPLRMNQQTQIHHLIPHLCHGNSTSTAIALLTTCLIHTSTPPHSLPFPVLISHLTTSSTVSIFYSLSLLSSAPRRHSIYLSTLLLSSFFKNRRPKDAMEVYRWVCKEEEENAVEVGKLVVVGLCRCGEVKEAMCVVRDLVRRSGGKRFVDAEVRKWVYWGLIREARVKEAILVGKALLLVGDDLKCAELVVDRVIQEFKE